MSEVYMDVSLTTTHRRETEFVIIIANAGNLGMHTSPLQLGKILTIRFQLPGEIVFIIFMFWPCPSKAKRWVQYNGVITLLYKRCKSKHKGYSQMLLFH